MTLNTGKPITSIMISKSRLHSGSGAESKQAPHHMSCSLLYCVFTAPRDIKIYGGGVINGNGQAWWNGFSGAEILDPNNKFYRPILFLTDNATNVEVTGLHLKDSPCWTTFMVRTKDVAFDNVYIDAVSNNVSVSVACIHSLIYILRRFVVTPQKH
jgi:polygalacturonase